MTSPNGSNPDVGDLLVLRVEEPAHGGHCVARHDGRVVFVRHAAPGELVRARITQRTSRLWRADSVEILEASPDRVEHVWPEAGPRGVGGAELGHLSLPAQRRWKTHVLGATLRRIGGEDVLAAVQDVTARAAEAGADDPLVEITALPSERADDADGLRTRTRVRFTADEDRRIGMFEHRSHDVRALRTMPLAAADLDALGLFTDPRWRRLWRPGSAIEVIAPSVGEPLVLVEGQAMNVHGPRKRANVRERVEIGKWAPPAGRESAADGAPNGAGNGAHDGTAGGVANAAMVGAQTRPAPSIPEVFEYRVAATGFWQVHPQAPAALVRGVLDAAASLGVGEGSRVVELYSGAGLLTAPLAALVTGEGSVVSIEQAPSSVTDARRNLHDSPWVQLIQDNVTPKSFAEAAGDAAADLVVLDPPRTGAGPEIMRAIADNGARGVVMVACDPAALARDLAAALEGGYELTGLQAFDLFPHTHHFETIATLRRE